MLLKKVMSLKKERDSLVQRMQHDSPSDTQRTRGLQRENAQVCLYYCVFMIMILYCGHGQLL